MIDLGKTLKRIAPSDYVDEEDVAEDQKPEKIVYPHLWINDVEIPGCEVGKKYTLEAVCTGKTVREEDDDDSSEECYTYEFKVTGIEPEGGSADEKPPKEDAIDEGAKRAMQKVEASKKSKSSKGDSNATTPDEKY